MTLALFDFDGTITNRDSLADFLQFAVGKKVYYSGIIKLLPVLISYKFNLISNERAKQKLINHFFKGFSLANFQALSEQYGLSQVHHIIRPKAMQKIKWHQEKAHNIAVVSASIENWIQPWCQQYGIVTIATQLETKNQQLTGQFSSKNCYGDEKVNRIRSVYNLQHYNDIYAYGDSEGDLAMLKLANKAYYKAFE